jgi:photosystem II stability/assembly factor-like uncharacterized protein
MAPHGLLTAVTAFAAVLLAGSETVVWTPSVSGTTAVLRGISAATNGAVWASGSKGTILRSEDGGRTWQPRGIPETEALDFRDIDAVSDRVAYVLSIGTGAASRIYKTADAGRSWTLQFSNREPEAFFDAMAFWDERAGIAVSDSVKGRFIIVTTADGGGSWTPVEADRLPAAQPDEGQFAASGTNVAVAGRDHVWIGTGAAPTARVLHSTDRGRTWSIAGTPLASGGTSGIYSIAFRDPTHGVITGGDYAREQDARENVAFTSDGGATWTLVRQRGVSGFRSVVAHVPGTPATWLAVGPSGSDISADDGQTWTSVPGPGYHTFAWAPDGTHGWGAGAGGRIARLNRR